MRLRSILSWLRGLAPCAIAVACGGGEFSSEPSSGHELDDADAADGGDAVSGPDTRHDGAGGSAGDARLDSTRDSAGGDGRADASIDSVVEDALADSSGTDEPIDGSGDGQGDDVHAGDAAPAEDASDAPAGDVVADSPRPDDGGMDADALESCTPQKYYFDQDGDGIGGGTFTMACSPLNDHWVTATGDCDDDNKDVNPKQTDWFDQPYTNSLNGAVSYDYDCKNGEEEESPGVAKSNGTCALLSGSLCSAGGYLVLSRSGSPAGADLDCGSTSFMTCTFTLGCTKKVATYPAIRCH